LEGRTDTEGVAAAGRWLEDSRRWFEEALARKRADPGTLSNLAFLEREAGRAPAALELVEEALGFDAEHFNARWVRGAVLCELDRFGAARPDLHQGVLNSLEREGGIFGAYADSRAFFEQYRSATAG